MVQPEITQRDLRSRFEELPDAVESGQSVTVTLGEFVAMSRNAATVDVDAFRADQDTAADQEAVDPYER